MGVVGLIFADLREQTEIASRGSKLSMTTRKRIVSRKASTLPGVQLQWSQDRPSRQTPTSDVSSIYFRSETRTTIQTFVLCRPSPNSAARGGANPWVPYGLVR